MRAGPLSNPGPYDKTVQVSQLLREPPRNSRLGRTAVWVGR